MEAADVSGRQGSRILLVGCGKVGTRLGERLHSGGGDVYALRRDTGALPSSFSALSIDLTGPPQRELPVFDAVVVTLSPAISAPGTRRPGYLVALENLARMLPRIPNRVVLVSSTRVFDGWADPRPITEADPPVPRTTRGRTLHAGEERAVELFNAHLVRPAGIYGSGRGMLLRKVIEHEPVQYARRTNRIHETDLVRTLELMLAMPDPPRVLHAVDQAPAPLGDVVTFIAQRLGVEPPPRVHPAEISGTILDGALLQSVLGSLEYPTFEAGYADLIAEYTAVEHAAAETDD